MLKTKRKEEEEEERKKKKKKKKKTCPNKQNVSNNLYIYQVQS